MSTIEITRIEDVQVGDLVTLEDRRDPSDDGIFKPDPEWRLIGHVRAIDVTTTDNDGRPYGWGVQIGHTPYPVGYLSPGGVMWAYSLVSATREVPEWEPGTVYEITTRNADGDTERAWCVDALDPNSWHGEKVKMFVNEHGDEYAAEELTSIKPLPDDAEALRRSLEVAREGYRKEAADWRARDTRMGAEIERLEAAVERLRREALKYKEAARKYLSEREKECAEVERWKAEAEMLTAKADRLMPLQEHENECAYRQRTEKAEAEVERLEAEVKRLEGLLEKVNESWQSEIAAAYKLRRLLGMAREENRTSRDAWWAEARKLESEVKRLRDSMDANTNVLISSNGTIWHHDTHCPHRRTMPTREQIVDAMWPNAPESARAGMTHLDIVDRILALYGQGDES